MSFKVLAPGVLTLVQDLGRTGYQHLGVTPGGPMDEIAFRWANRLLNNPADAAALEITFGGLKLEVLAETTLALTGADLDAQINDRTVESWRTYRVKRGDLLSFTRPRAGLRAYVAVQGGLQVKTTLGSCSTVTRERLGGLTGCGDPIAKGDLIPFHTSAPHTDARVPLQLQPDYTEPLCLALIPGYQIDQFSTQTQTRFFDSEYKISDQIDRMGYRLQGDPIETSCTGIISEGIAYGAVQVPADGQPIVLMRDRQTIGGYPKLGSISRLSAAALSQRAPGASVSFEPIELNHARADWTRLFESLNSL